MIDYFTADADTWCAACVVAAYGEGALDGSALDREGNQVGAAFSTDEGTDCDVHCAECGALLKEAYQ